MEVSGKTRRVVLEEGRTLIGRGNATIEVEDAGVDQVHVWNDPPRAVFLGTGEPPHHNGKPFDEVGLRPGDVLEWRGVRMCYGGEAAPGDLASLEELAPVESSAAPTVQASVSPAMERVTQRLLAGLMVEQGLADRGVTGRWQSEVREGRFDADRCAREVLVASGTPDEMRLLERSARLQRDFLMSPLLRGTKGAGRKARRAAKNGLAFLLAQGIGLFVYSAILAAIMLFLRVRGTNFDALLDRILMRD